MRMMIVGVIPGFKTLLFVFQELGMAKRQNLQKMAAFNLGVAEAVHDKKRQRETEFQVSKAKMCYVVMMCL